MTRSRRWALVGVLLAALLSLPSIIGALPAGQSSVTAAQLLTAIQGSSGVAYSGYAESSGGLALPVTTQFSSVGDLLGGTTQLRVWSRGASDWRVDSISVSGETDVHQDADGTWTWDYESNTATRALGDDPSARLPQAEDLVPAQLARRVLGHASAAQVTRLGDERVAGHDAAGLRLRPSDPRSTIDHVDVWALASSGLGVRVQVYGKGDANPVLETEMLDLSVTTPSASTTAFTPPAKAKVHYDRVTDLVAALDRFVRVRPPATLAGLPREDIAQSGAVGVYGTDVTALIAVPLPREVVGQVAKQLTAAVGAVVGDAGTALTVGPLNLLLTTPISGSSWLLVGSVTPATLTSAASQLPAVRFGR
jgi:hypothetical protein